MKPNLKFSILLAGITGVISLFISTPSHAAMTCEGLFESEYQMVEGDIRLFGGIGEERPGTVRWDPNNGKVYIRFGNYTGGNADIVYVQEGNSFKEIFRQRDFIWSPAESSLRAATSTKPMTSEQIRAAKEQVIANRAAAPSVYDWIRIIAHDGSFQHEYKTRWDRATQTLYIMDPLKQVAGVYAKDGTSIQVIQQLRGWEIYPGELERLMQKPRRPEDYDNSANFAAVSSHVVGRKTSATIVMIAKGSGLDATFNTRWNSTTQTLTVSNSAGRVVAIFVKNGDEIREIQMLENWFIKEQDIRTQMQ